MWGQTNVYSLRVEISMNKLSVIILTATALPFAAVLSAAQTSGPVAASVGVKAPGAPSPANSGGGTGGAANAQAGPKPTVESVFANNDLNKDAIITKAEATASGGRMIFQWDLYDANKDNRADTEEVVKGLAAVAAQSAAAPPSGAPNAVRASHPAASPSAGKSTDASSAKSTMTTPAGK
jgi:hypothetical protein